LLRQTRQNLIIKHKWPHEEYRFEKLFRKKEFNISWDCLCKGHVILQFRLGNEFCRVMTHTTAAWWVTENPPTTGCVPALLITKAGSGGFFHMFLSNIVIAGYMGTVRT
jgi:hypothetical protein